jgi:hypothetical protein
VEVVEQDDDYIDGRAGPVVSFVYPLILFFPLFFDSNKISFLNFKSFSFVVSFILLGQGEKEKTDS